MYCQEPTEPTKQQKRTGKHGRDKVIYRRTVNKAPRVYQLANCPSSFSSKHDPCPHAPKAVSGQLHRRDACQPPGDHVHHTWLMME